MFSVARDTHCFASSGTYSWLRGRGSSCSAGLVTVAGAQAETASGDDKSWLKLRVDEVVGMIVALIERVRTPNPRLQRSTAADGSALRGSTRATNRCGGH